MIVSFWLFSECPSNCNECTVDHADNDKTKCTASECAAWDGKKAYTNGDDGACVSKFSFYLLEINQQNYICVIITNWFIYRGYLHSQLSRCCDNAMRTILKHEDSEA
jgi:hypothetical protein